MPEFEETQRNPELDKESTYKPSERKRENPKESEEEPQHSPIGGTQGTQGSNMRGRWKKSARRSKFLDQNRPAAREVGEGVIEEESHVSTAKPTEIEEEPQAIVSQPRREYRGRDREERRSTSRDREERKPKGEEEKEGRPSRFDKEKDSSKRKTQYPRLTKKPGIIQRILEWLGLAPKKKYSSEKREHHGHRKAYAGGRGRGRSRGRGRGQGYPESKGHSRGGKQED